MEQKNIKKILLLFDVDGTIAYSGKKIDHDIQKILESLSVENFELGIVGGGTFEKIQKQVGTSLFTHIFSECGCQYFKKKENEFHSIYSKNIMEHSSFPEMKVLIQKCLHFIGSQIKCEISGNFIDRRKGLYYISLVGMQANDKERQNFIIYDNLYHYRENLIEYLKINLHPDIDVKIGGSTGITILPKTWNKSQIMDHIDHTNYKKIFYFGDKYEENGNDFELIHYALDSLIGVPVKTVDDTVAYLKEHFKPDSNCL